MLRGRSFYAISGHPTRSTAPPLLATSHSSLATAFVTPLFPLLTQKQGGGGPETSLFSFSANRTIARSRPSGSSRLRLCALGVLCGESLFNSGDSAPNFQIPAKNIETAYITVQLSIIRFNIVGAPTFLIPHANRKSQSLSASEGGLSTNIQPSTGYPAKDAHPERAHCGRRVEGSPRSLATRHS